MAQRAGAIIRVNKYGDVSVLCPLGHLIDYHNHKDDYSGSSFSAELAFREHGDRFDRLAWKCQGYGHGEGETIQTELCLVSKPVQEEKK